MMNQTSTKDLIILAHKSTCIHNGGDFWRNNALTMTKSALRYFSIGDEINAREMAYKALAELCVEDCLKITS